jgi:hypothetical protein
MRDVVLIGNATFVVNEEKLEETIVGGRHLFSTA